MEIKIGEAQGRMTSNINKTDEPRILLRVIYKNKTNEVAFNPTEDLKIGYEIKVTVEKVSEPPKTDDDKNVTAETG